MSVSVRFVVPACVSVSLVVSGLGAVEAADAKAPVHPPASAAPLLSPGLLAAPASLVPLEDRTTETSSTWLMPDGSLSTEAYGAPVNYRDEAGAWQKIDNDLVPAQAAGVAVENAANDYTVSLPQDAGTTPVRFAADGDWVSFAMDGLDGAPSVQASEATYANAGDASEVVYQAAATGVKESIVLDAAPAAAPMFTFDLQMDAGLRPVLRPNGDIEIRDSSGTAEFTMPAPFMVDSTPDIPAVSTEVTTQLGQVAGGWQLTVSPDEAWLQDPARVYPVVVDPSITDTPSKYDGWIDEAAPTTNQVASTYLRVGGPSGSRNRALVKFGLDALPANATVTDATLKLYLDTNQTTGSGTSEFIARRVTEDWDQSALTWNRRLAGTGGLWSTPGGVWAASSLPGATLSGTGISGYRGFDVGPFVQSWIDGVGNTGGPFNYGLIVRKADDGTDRLLRFFSNDSADSSRWPMLVVNYTEPTPPAASEAGQTKYFTYTTEKLTDRIQAKVNVGNGNLLVSAQDANVSGVAGLDLAIQRTYNSATAATAGSDLSKLGPGWSDNLGGSVRLEFPNADEKRVLYFGPSGYRVRFDKSVAGGYIRREPGMDGNLRFDSSTNTFRIEMYSKQVYVFTRYNAADLANSGQLKEIHDKSGNKLTFAYNANGTLDTATDTRNRVAKFTYRADGMLGSIDIKNTSGTPLVTYTYDYAGSPLRLVSSKVDAVNTTALPTTTNTDDVDALTTYGYDANGRLNQIKDARETTTNGGTGGGTTTIEYTSAGKVWKVNRLTDDTTLPDSTSTYTYPTTLPSNCNSEGTHATQVDGERLASDVDDTTTYCADNKDRVVRTIDAKGNVRKTTWTANSNIDSFDASGLSSGGSSFTYSYDSNDNPTSVTTPSGGTATAQYSDPANPNFPTSMRDFDTGGSTSQPATWNYDYDDDGNLIEAAAPVTTGNNIRYRYCWDGNGQLQRIDPIDATGASSVSLDNDLNAGCGTANQGNDTLLSYDASNQLQTIDPPGTHRTQTYTYDALSRVKTVTDGRGVVTTYSYDALDRVVGETFDATGATGVTGTTTLTVTWTYDRAGNLTQLTDPTGPTTFIYDELNRVISQSQQLPSNTKTYRYDPADNLTEAEVSDEPEPAKYAYDPVNLVTSVDDQRAGVNKVTFAYDRHDKRIKTIFPMPDGNDVIERAKYNDGGRVICIYSYRKNNPPVDDTQSDPACPAATAAGLLTFARYDYTTTVAGITIDTNTRYGVTDKGGVKTSYTYDPISRLTAATTKAGNGTTTLRSFDYTYDRHSNLTKQVITNPNNATPPLTAGTTYFAYDDAEELCWTQVSTTTPTGGCASPPTGATTYTRDGAGALTGSSAGLSLLYNAIGQTTSIDPAGATPAIPMTYTGVTQDRRITKGTLEMSYGFAGLSSQSDNSGVPHAEWYVRDPDGKLVAQIDARQGGSDPDRYYLTDAQDSVIATIDTTGQVRRYLYQPYGEQIRTWIDTNPTNNTSNAATAPDGSGNPLTSQDQAPESQPWRYASGYYDTETGMLKFGTRYYMPNLARWTQTDPKSGNPQNPLTLNPYLYAGQNPAGETDPSGRYIGEDLLEDTWDSLTDADWGLVALGSVELLEGLEAIGIGATVATVGSPTIVAVILGVIIAVAGGGTLLAIGGHTIYEGFTG